MDPDDLEDQEREKEKKIKLFQQRLDKIRNAALFMDDICQLHQVDSKKRKQKLSELDDNERFLKDRIF